MFVETRPDQSCHNVGSWRNESMGQTVQAVKAWGFRVDDHGFQDVRVPDADVTYNSEHLRALLLSHSLTTWKDERRCWLIFVAATNND